jgi:cephalosporin hydroxylase
VIKIDLEGGTVTVEDGGGERTFPLQSEEAFSATSAAWLRCGWDAKYVYGFTWMGRPIIQLPEDMIRIQEVIYHLKPDVIVETGVAHGGSLILYASLCKAMGHGRVIGIDIEIRPHNRKALEAHELFEFLTLIEGDSTAPDVVERVKAEVAPGETAVVVLDSHHSKDHVLAELEAYGPLVPPGSYVVVCDGIMEGLAGAPRSEPDWTWNNPKAAAEAFVSDHPEFIIEPPAFPFNEGMITQMVTYWPGAWVKRIG